MTDLERSRPSKSILGAASPRRTLAAKLLRPEYFVPTLAAALAVLNLYCWFPGALNGDSAGQYQQAVSGHLNDWQPPIMASMWILMRPIANGAWPLFVLNTALFWLGCGLIAKALVEVGHARLAYVTLFGASSPLFLFFNRQIITDVGLASALLAAFGITFFFRVQRRPLPKPVWPPLVAILVYGTLVRTNAVFAVPPLVLYACGVRPSTTKSLRWMLACFLLSVAVIPISILTNRSILGAADSGGMQRLQIYDIVGVGFRSGDHREINEAAGFVPRPLSRCYTPVLWDTLLYSQCGNLWERLPPPGSAARGHITYLWIEAILRHPISYAIHRLEHFNVETFFMVPAAAQCVSAPELHDCGQQGSASERMIRGIAISDADYLLKNPLVWPITWLTIGVTLLFSRWSPRDELVCGAHVLLVSGIMYGALYLFVGVAMNVRYFYWTILAVQTSATLLVLHNFKTSGRHSLLNIVIAVSAVVFTGYVFRIGDITLLVR